MYVFKMQFNKGKKKNCGSVQWGGRRRRKKKTRSPSADALWAAYSGISQKLKASNEDSATPPRLAQRDRQATWSLYIEA